MAGPAVPPTTALIWYLVSKLRVKWEIHYFDRFFRNTGASFNEINCVLEKILQKMCGVL